MSRVLAPFIILPEDYCISVRYHDIHLQYYVLPVTIDTYIMYPGTCSFELTAEGCITTQHLHLDTSVYN